MVTKRKPVGRKPSKSGQVTARIDAERVRMLDELTEKFGIDRTSIVSVAITEKYERDFPTKQAPKK